VKAKRALKQIKAVCLECGRKFRTASALPECPRCGGSDVDVDEPVLSEEWRAPRVKFGTMVGDDMLLRKQVVRGDDGEMHYLAYGLDAAKDAQVGDRIRLEYRATRSRGLWYGSVVKPGKES